MKVSIIIPVYNVSLYIRDCLQSVLRQTYQDIEVIIVNDRTEDDSMEVVASLLKSMPHTCPVRIVEHEVNRGLSAARNTGIGYATGEYLYFLDSDDEITENCIGCLVESLRDMPVDIVVGDYEVRNSDVFFPPLQLDDCVLDSRKSIIRYYMKERIYVMAWNKMIRRDFLTKNRLFFKEGLIHEDVLWSFQCMCLAKTVSIVRKVTYIYKVRPVSIKTNTRFVKDFEACKTVIRELAEFAEAHNLLRNKYVSAYIEAEKLRLLYLCRDAGVERTEYVPLLYGFVREVPHVSLFRFLCWNFFSIRKLIREAHYYMLSVDSAGSYFWSIPDLWVYRKGFFRQCCYYVWFLKLLCARVLHSSHVSPLKFLSE